MKKHWTEKNNILKALSKIILCHTGDHLKFTAKQEDLIKGITSQVSLSKSLMAMRIHDFSSLGIGTSTHCFYYRYCFVSANGMARVWEFIMSGLWILTHPPITSVKNLCNMTLL